MMKEKKTGFVTKFNQVLNVFKEKILDPKSRETLIFELSFWVLGLVSLFMSLVNIVTGEYRLMIATLVFSACCIASSLLFFRGNISRAIAKYLFETAIIAIAIFFTVTGYPNGFSIIWTALLPACGLMLFGFASGSVMSALILAEIVFFFRIPIGQSLLMYDYGDVFMLRFPFLFIAFYCVGLALFFMLKTTQEAYQNLSEHDQLTGAYNRVGFKTAIDTGFDSSRTGNIGFIIADIDHFKHVNDTYGHFAGDTVLKNTVELIREAADAPVCRWGGEEFAIFIEDGERAAEIAENIRVLIEQSEIECENFVLHETISLGVFITSVKPGIIPTTLWRRADACLYRAKESGRNKVITEWEI